MKTLTWEEFLAEGKALFGNEKPLLWWFKCPVCGHEQQGKEMIEKYPDKKEYIIDSVFFSCEGRLMQSGRSAFAGKPTAKTGCDYTNGGLINLAEKEVIAQDGHHVSVFEFAEGRAV